MKISNVIKPCMKEQVPVKIFLHDPLTRKYVKITDLLLIIMTVYILKSNDVRNCIRYTVALRFHKLKVFCIFIKLFSCSQDKYSKSDRISVD